MTENKVQLIEIICHLTEASQQGKSTNHMIIVTSDGDSSTVAKEADVIVNQASG